jgi:hypothetical protein
MEVSENDRICWRFAAVSGDSAGPRGADIPGDTRRCRGVWADELGPSAQTKMSASGGWREAHLNRRHLDFQPSRPRMVKTRPCAGLL